MFKTWTKPSSFASLIWVWNVKLQYQWIVSEQKPYPTEQLQFWMVKYPPRDGFWYMFIPILLFASCFPVFFFFGSICHKIDTHRLYHFSESSATQWLTTFIRETKTDVIWWLNRIGQRTRIQVRITTQQSQLDNVSLQWRHGDKLVIYNLTFDCVLFAFASLRYKDVN